MSISFWKFLQRHFSQVHKNSAIFVYFAQKIRWFLEKSAVFRLKNAQKSLKFMKISYDCTKRLFFFVIFFFIIIYIRQMVFYILHIFSSLSIYFLKFFLFFRKIHKLLTIFGNFGVVFEHFLFQPWICVEVRNKIKIPIFKWFFENRYSFIWFFED